MTATATCRSTSSAAGTCWRRSCAAPTPMRAAGAVEEVARIVAQIRRRWPRTRILLRGDSGFCREPLMAWCEANRVDYVFGLAGNDRLDQAIVPELISADDREHPHRQVGALLQGLHATEPGTVGAANAASSARPR